MEENRKKLLRLEIAKTGTYGAGGNTITLQDLKDVIDTFDGKTPISLGHYMTKQDWWPSWGNVENIQLNESENGVDATMVADISVNEALAKAIKSGFYPGWSVSIPSRAADGKRYLHHLAFLGATPPAIRDLKIIATNDDAIPENAIKVEKEGEGFQYGDIIEFGIADFTDGVKEIDAVGGNVITETKERVISEFSDNALVAKARNLLKLGVKTKVEAALKGKIPAGMNDKVSQFCDAACSEFDFSDETEQPAIIELFLDIVNAMSNPKPQTGRSNFGDHGNDNQINNRQLADNMAAKF